MSKKPPYPYYTPPPSPPPRRKPSSNKDEGSEEVRSAMNEKLNSYLMTLWALEEAKEKLENVDREFPGLLRRLKDIILELRGKPAPSDMEDLLREAERLVYNMKALLDAAARYQEELDRKWETIIKDGVRDLLETYSPTQSVRELAEKLARDLKTIQPYKSFFATRADMLANLLDGFIGRLRESAEEAVRKWRVPSFY
jgi:hypothetical protein